MVNVERSWLGSMAICRHTFRYTDRSLASPRFYQKCWVIRSLGRPSVWAAWLHPAYPTRWPFYTLKKWRYVMRFWIRTVFLQSEKIARINTQQQPDSIYAWLKIIRLQRIFLSIDASTRILEMTSAFTLAWLIPLVWSSGIRCTDICYNAALAACE
jgi:hypothetical protein